MSIERLLAGLERSAETEAERLLTEARAEAAQIGEAARERRGRRHETALAERSTAWRTDDARALADARRRARAETLAARERLIERVLGAARTRFPDAIRSEAYATILPRQLIEALRYVGTRRAVVRCSPTLAPALRALIAEQSGVVLEIDEEAAPGFLLETDDGALTVDATLEGRLLAAGPAVALEVADLAFRPAP